MKDLFVELCLTVPVRLSSLLPFLPMLMDPLVSALNGSPMLVTQGLRTLELCVDNLLPDFFYDHIQCVRAELMQALWKTLRNPDNSSLGAFRILGKFGGGNRNMLIQPQTLEVEKYDERSTSLSVIYADQEVKFPVHKVMETALTTLKNASVEPFYLTESWNVVRFYLAATMSLEDDHKTLCNLFTHESFINGKVTGTTQTSFQYDEKSRKTLQVALTAMFIAAANKDLQESALPVTISVVRQFTLVAIAQQAGPFQSGSWKICSDPMVIVDALVEVMGNEEHEIRMFGQSVLSIIIKTATCVMGNKNRACQLPLMDCIAEKMIQLCYENSWFAKKGGCTALKHLCDQLSVPWIYKSLFSIIKVHLYIIRDLSDDVCSGSIDLAMSNIEFILNKTVTALMELNQPNEEVFNKIHKTVVNEFVVQTSSPHAVIRQVATKSLRQIAAIQKITVAALLEPFKSFFSEMTVFSPPKTYLRHQPLSTQIGILEANYFCTSLEPKLMKFDNFQLITDVKIIIKYDDDTMSRYDAYKDPKQLPELRETAMKVLVSWHYIYHLRHYDSDKVQNVNFCDEAFVTLFKAMETYPSLQDTAFECLKRLTVECKEKCETGWPIQNSFLDSLGDYMSWTLNSIKRLSYYSLLFPKVFTEKTCDQLLEIVKKFLQSSLAANKDQNYLKIAKTGENEQKIAAIINLFHQIPAASSKYVICLLRLVLATEEGISLETSSPYRAGLVKFLIRYPDETMNYLMTDESVRNPQINRFTIYLLKHKDGAPFKAIMENNAVRLKELITKERTSYRAAQLPAFTPKDDFEAQHQAVLIVSTLIALNDQWLPTQMIIVNALNQIWMNELPRSDELSIVCDLWHLVAKILLHYFEHNPADINLLYQLLKVYNMRLVPDFQVSFEVFSYFSIIKG